MMMKPKESMERLPFLMPSKTVEALERMRVSYGEAIAETPMFEADQAVQKVVDLILRSARNAQRTA